MRRVVAALLTILLMVGLLWSGLRRPSSAPESKDTSSSGRRVSGSSPSDPYAGAETLIRTLLNNARSGQVRDYLSAFEGPLRDRLDREVAERGEPAFAAQLKSAAASRKSHAVFAPEPDGPDAARVTVESVYPDRNERQTFFVEQNLSGWSVTRVETVRSRLPAVKVGSLATFEGPEGVPVPTQSSPPPNQSPSPEGP